MFIACTFEFKFYFLVHYTECDDGFIRFVEETVKLDDSGSSGPLITGISEVCINNTWASICDESYLELNSSEAIQQAQLFCDGLGYAGIVTCI